VRESQAPEQPKEGLGEVYLRRAAGERKRGAVWDERGVPSKGPGERGERNPLGTPKGGKGGGRKAVSIKSIKKKRKKERKDRDVRKPFLSLGKRRRKRTGRKKKKATSCCQREETPHVSKKRKEGEQSQGGATQGAGRRELSKEGRQKDVPSRTRVRPAREEKGSLAGGRGWERRGGIARPLQRRKRPWPV